jgi:hypothetical protein
MARPTKPAKDRQSAVIALRLTPAEFGKLKRSAGKRKVSDYIRQKLGLRGQQ